MAANDTTTLHVTTSVGRLVTGSVHLKRDKEKDGSPRLVKNGPNAGQPYVTYDFGVAFKKTPGIAHWSQEPTLGLIGENAETAAPWFQEVWKLGHAEFPALAQRPDFSWKIVDGDDTMPNLEGNKNCDKEGFPGHWVVYFSNQAAPMLRDYTTGVEKPLPNPDAIKRGFFVQVMCDFRSNKPAQSPGLYCNHRAVALIAYGTPMASATQVDVSKAGFGRGIALPEGATLTPPPAMSAPSPAPAPQPAAPAPAPAPAPVVPAHDLVKPGPVLTAKAAQEQPGVTYDAFIAAGWTDDNLRAQGYLA